MAAEQDTCEGKEKGESTVHCLSTGRRRVDIQTLIIDSVRQLKQPIAVSGLWGNFLLNHAV